MIYTMEKFNFVSKNPTFENFNFLTKLSYFHSVFYNICCTNDRKASDLYKNKNGE